MGHFNAGVNQLLKKFLLWRSLDSWYKIIHCGCSWNSTAVFTLSFRYNKYIWQMAPNLDLMISFASFLYCWFVFQLKPSLPAPMLNLNSQRTMDLDESQDKLDKLKRFCGSLGQMGFSPKPPKPSLSFVNFLWILWHLEGLQICNKPAKKLTYFIFAYVRDAEISFKKQGGGDKGSGGLKSSPFNHKD